MINVTKGLVPFWDDYMIDTARTTATLSSNTPAKRGVVMDFDQPWDGNGNDFFTIIKDDGIYRMYYETWTCFDPTYTEGINVCYAESKDGIHWERPNLGICEFRGSRDNNIIMTRIYDNITVMKDENPNCPPEHKYKAVMANYDDTIKKTNPNLPAGKLVCKTSADGIHFNDYSVISSGYAYDSQNTLHWNPHLKKYFCYFRNFHNSDQNQNSLFNEKEIRDIMVTESEDFIHWSEPKLLNFGDREDYPLYTNCVSAYPYDTRYYIGFPTRYVERKSWTKNYDRLCGLEKRKARMERNPRYGLVVTDCVFMSSRDNVNWYRFDEACLTPGREYDSNWVYGDCYPAIGGVVETPSPFHGEPDELSIYTFDHHMMLGEMGHLIRYAFRRDGFASVKAPYEPATLRTKPFSFDADELSLNFKTSARGGIYLTILDENGFPIDGYETCEIFGDSLDRTIDFDLPLSDLKGRSVIFEFKMRDAEIFAMRFK